MESNKNCVLGALCVGTLVAFSMALITPEHPEKPFIEENTALRADNILLQEKIEKILKAEVEQEKKLTQEAKAQCGK